MQVTDEILEALDTLDDQEKADGAKIHAADVIAAHRRKLPQDTLDRVHAHLGDVNTAVRHSLVRALLFSGNDTSIPHLEGVLEKERDSDWVRRSAETALYRLKNGLEAVDGQSCVYVGEINDGAASGTGRMYYAYSGELLYEGGFRDGSFHGAGTLYNDDGAVLQKGTFANGTFQG